MPANTVDAQTMKKKKSTFGILGQSKMLSQCITERLSLVILTAGAPTKTQTTYCLHSNTGKIRFYTLENKSIIKFFEDDHQWSGS